MNKIFFLNDMNTNLFTITPNLADFFVSLANFIQIKKCVCLYVLKNQQRKHFHYIWLVFMSKFINKLLLEVGF